MGAGVVEGLPGDAVGIPPVFGLGVATEEDAGASEGPESLEPECVPSTVGTSVPGDFTGDLVELVQCIIVGASVPPGEYPGDTVGGCGLDADSSSDFVGESVSGEPLGEEVAPLLCENEGRRVGKSKVTSDSEGAVGEYVAVEGITGEVVNSKPVFVVGPGVSVVECGGALMIIPDPSETEGETVVAELTGDAVIKTAWSSAVGGPVSREETPGAKVGSYTSSTVGSLAFGDGTGVVPVERSVKIEGARVSEDRLLLVFGVGVGVLSGTGSVTIEGACVDPSAL